MENWNSANDKIFYGREGVLTGADREHAEVSMLTLHLLQSARSAVGRQTDGGRPARAQPAVLGSCESLRPVPAGHGYPARPHCGLSGSPRRLLEPRVPVLG
ncbi:hypothetical protein [Nonomuraea sp. SBT364]|uniref:hypothetical protein n=1 Tax=Nonomuraea sp. SBT364 TaxID=1580530 RepID=UPI0022B13BF4|nr:hypothetical protein [Nonomuraea sp. SBT364]